MNIKKTFARLWEWAEVPRYLEILVLSQKSWGSAIIVIIKMVDLKWFQNSEESGTSAKPLSLFNSSLYKVCSMCLYVYGKVLSFVLKAGIFSA